MPLEDPEPTGRGTSNPPAGDEAVLAPNGEPVRAAEYGASTNGFGKVGESVLPCGPGAPRAARTAVTDWLTRAVAPRMLDDMRLIVTELVTNSVRHAQLRAGDAITVRIRLAEHGLRLEVENPGTAGRITANGRAPQAGGGLGLQLVERLCMSWGVVRDRDTTVWVEMEHDDPTR